MNPILITLFSLLMITLVGCQTPQPEPAKPGVTASSMQMRVNDQQLSLPATYSGVTPCADCPGIEETLTLNADNTFKLSRIYQERSTEPFVENGHWTVEGNQLILKDKTGQQYYEIASGDILRHLDQTGNPIDTKANIDLHRLGQPAMHLLDIHWTLIGLEGDQIPTAPDIKREIGMLLSGQNSRVTGFSGCNRFMGQFELKDEELKFSKLAGTRMACLPPAMELENRVLSMLAATTTYKIEDNVLFLLEGTKTLAEFKPANR